MFSSSFRSEGSSERWTCPRSLYVAARAGFEPTTLRSTGIGSTNEPPRPTCSPLPSDLKAAPSDGLAQGPYTWRLERDSNPRPSDRQVSALPMSHHVPHVLLFLPI